MHELTDSILALQKVKNTLYVTRYLFKIEREIQYIKPLILVIP